MTVTIIKKRQQLSKEEDLRKFYKPGYSSIFLYVINFRKAPLVGPSQNLLPSSSLCNIDLNAKRKIHPCPKWFSNRQSKCPEGRKHSCRTCCNFYKQKVFSIVFPRAPPPPNAPYRIRFILTIHSIFLTVRFNILFSLTLPSPLPTERSGRSG